MEFYGSGGWISQGTFNQGSYSIGVPLSKVNRKIYCFTTCVTSTLPQVFNGQILFFNNNTRVGQLPVATPAYTISGQVSTLISMPCIGLDTAYFGSFSQGTYSFSGTTHQDNLNIFIPLIEVGGDYWAGDTYSIGAFYLKGSFDMLKFSFDINSPITGAVYCYLGCLSS